MAFGGHIPASRKTLYTFSENIINLLVAVDVGRSAAHAPPPRLPLAYDEDEAVAANTAESHGRSRRGR